MRRDVRAISMSSVRIRELAQLPKFLGDAIFNNKTRLARVIFCVHLPISRLS